MRSDRENSQTRQQIIMKNIWVTISILCTISISAFSQEADKMESENKGGKENKEMETLFQANKSFGSYVGFAEKVRQLEKRSFVF